MIDIAIIIVKNSKNELYVHKRSAHKKKFPNLYGIGAGGKIDEGETPPIAAKRELFEELGIETPLEFLFEITYLNEMNLHVFITNTEEILNPCSREFSWAGWLSFNEIDELVSTKQLCPDTQLFYQKFKEEFNTFKP